MSDHPVSCCPHYQQGLAPVCQSCASVLPSQIGQGRDTSLSAEQQAALYRYYASRQTQSAITQARAGIDRMTHQLTTSGNVYRDNGTIVAAASGTPGPYYPYPLTLANDPAIVSAAQGGYQQAPTQQPLPNSYQTRQIQGRPGQGDAEARGNQQRSHELPRQTPRSSSQQQSQHRPVSSQHPRSNRSDPVQPRDGSIAGQYMSTRPSRQQHYQNVQRTYDSRDDSDEEYW